jgi:hypothetical protein
MITCEVKKLVNRLIVTLLEGRDMQFQRAGNSWRAIPGGQFLVGNFWWVIPGSVKKRKRKEKAVQWADCHVFL